MPEWADPRELDPEVRRDLRGLSKEGSEFVAGHLFMAGMLAEEDPALAWRHARAARSKGGRIAVVRETVGLVAYRAGEWAEAIAELRAARRMSGGPGQLPVMADCERALGHPEKAIELSRSADAAELDPSSTAELTIVVAGARADMGQLDAALANLESAIRAIDVEPYTARLFYAYADLLLQAQRRDEAIEYFMKAADLDVEEETDAGERLTELADEEVESSGTGVATEFVVVDNDEDDDYLVDNISHDTETATHTDTDTQTEADDGVEGSTGSAHSGEESFKAERVSANSDEQSGSGDFYSDEAEQDNLLLTDEDNDDDDLPTVAASPVTHDQSRSFGLTPEQAHHLDEDDDQAQASTETTEPTEVRDSAPASAVTVDPVRAASNSGTTGSLFSHHEGGL